MSSHQPSPGPSTHSLSTKQKQKAHTISIGIAAGAEDAKYQAKYRDLKRKVKEIETDNDKLHFKVLQAKRSIQRMKLERAILYERLSGSPHVAEAPIPPPPVPDLQTLRPPSLTYLHDVHHPDRSISEYPLAHDRPRIMMSDHDGRSISAMASTMHSPPRRSSSGVHEPVRHLQHMPSLPPVPHIDSSRSHGHSRSHPSPTIYHSHSDSSHQPTRSRSRTRHTSGHAYLQGQTLPQHYPDPMPLAQHPMHSPTLADRERTKRQDVHDFPGLHGDPHGNGRNSGYISHHSPPMHPSEVRSSNRHHRVGPPAYIRDEHYERQRDMEREREWEREQFRNRGHGRDVSGPHILSPPITHKTRQAMDRGDYAEHHMSRIREDLTYYRDPPPPPPPPLPPPGPGSYPIHSRSGTPGSGSGSGIGAGEGPSRPDSRPHYYDVDRTRAYRLRPVNQTNEEMDFVHEDGRSIRDHGGGGGGSNFPLPEPSRSSMESRKRGRNDMDVDSDDGGEDPNVRMSEDRGSKRHHHHRRSGDSPGWPSQDPL